MKRKKCWSLIPGTHSCKNGCDKISKKRSGKFISNLTHKHEIASTNQVFSWLWVKKYFCTREWPASPSNGMILQWNSCLSISGHILRQSLFAYRTKGKWTQFGLRWNQNSSSNVNSIHISEYKNWRKKTFLYVPLDE